MEEEEDQPEDDQSEREIQYATIKISIWQNAIPVQVAAAGVFFYPVY